MPLDFHAFAWPSHLPWQRLLHKRELRGQLFRTNHSLIAALLPCSTLILERNLKLLRLERALDLSYDTRSVNLSLPDALRQELAAFPETNPPVPGGFPGGLVGWLGYDDGPPCSRRGPVLPAASIGLYDTFIVLPADGQATLYTLNTDVAHFLLRLAAAPGPDQPFRLTAPFSALTSQSEYALVFGRVQEYLLAGDCYQVNLAQDFKARCQGESLDAFLVLDSLMNPPHACYAASPEGDILSLSPELFLKFHEGEVFTRPIKGTRPRGRDADEDQRLHQELASHPKDKAENLMIVDLLRNDLGKHAVTGSVKTVDLFRIESFAHVHHMISEVRCRLRPDAHPIDLLLDASPGGSITGAPKRRAMEIIRELEAFDRTIYCGSMGWMTRNGDGEWNIAIRTLARVGNEIHAWAGGGIVADSGCESEYQECLNKIGPILKALEDRFLTPEP